METVVSKKAEVVIPNVTPELKRSLEELKKDYQSQLIEIDDLLKKGNHIGCVVNIIKVSYRSNSDESAIILQFNPSPNSSEDKSVDIKILEEN